MMGETTTTSAIITNRKGETDTLNPSDQNDCPVPVFEPVSSPVALELVRPNE